ncbi:MULTISPECIES: hypothetical protein [Stenotrophomonas]|uniref:hypothetical protein n=1 Tax=Stenotrophomonas TaxID=40323 RepID=UPI000B672EF2|nr:MULTISPECIES: hypothetical protein [Stenotrophomonas]SMR69276.1 hypothetical protein SAMN04487863_0266 [Stenotrophomonas sp. yr243]SNT57983.1 hypothetical protein SAMN05518671_3647 [Stenotrophomonas lactitubi]
MKDPLILQFRADATEPTPAGLTLLRSRLAEAFPDRAVVLLPCGMEVAPGSQESLLEINGKLDALLTALAAEGEDGQDEPSRSLDGELVPGERDQSQSLG